MPSRRDFMEEINSFDDLVNFCNEYNYYELTDNLYSNDARDEYIENDLNDYWVGEGWERAREFLSGLEDSGSYDWWVHDDWGDWVGLGDYELDEWKNNIADSLEEDGFFEENDDEEDDDIVFEEPDVEDECEGEFSLEDFIDDFDNGTVISWPEPEVVELEEALIFEDDEENEQENEPEKEPPMLSSAEELTVLWG